MAYIVMAYIVMAYIVMACIVMAYIVMACIVMAYLRPKPEVAGATTSAFFFRGIDKTGQNRALCGQGFPAMCHMPSLDNAILIDLCLAKCDVA